MALRTNYKDDIFSGNRKYTQISNGDGTISFVDSTQYSQVGDTFGATQINEIDGKINTHDTNISTINTNIGTINTNISNLNSELTANGTKFYFDYKNGKWGWNSSSARGAGTFHPFKTADAPTYAYYDFSITLNMTNNSYTTASAQINIGIYGRITRMAFLQSISCTSLDTYIAQLYDARVSSLSGNVATVSVTARTDRSSGGVHIYNGTIVGVYYED